MVPHRGGDFAANNRLLLLSGFAIAIGGLSTVSAMLLLALIRFFTNLFYFHSVSVAATSPADNRLGWLAIFVPALGGLIVGLMARYGSEKIRGHGIPEAIEAILFGKSRMSPKVAVLEPLSSGIVIGSGGPFGASRSGGSGTAARCGQSELTPRGGYREPQRSPEAVASAPRRRKSPRAGVRLGLLPIITRSLPKNH